MSKLPALSSRQIIAAPRRAGFVEAPHRGKGSHRAFCRTRPSGQVHLVIVPQGRDIPKGTVLAILGQAGLSRDELLELL